ncbi:MAG TPA: ABC transporter permease [Fimbriimonadaceae bacterium]|nr:ABC transporter permease [Fimbriimonadaceae bacterium]
MLCFHAAMSRTQALRLFQRYQGLIGLAVLFAVAFFLARKEFFSAANFVNILKQLAVPGTLAIGMSFVIFTGGIDLSVGSLLALGNVILAEWASHGTGIVPSVLYAVSLSAAIGALVGWLIGATKLQPFIVTLAAMVTLRGISYLYTNNAIVSITDNRFAFLQDSDAGLPTSAWILLCVTVASAILLRFSVFGRHVYALGGNETAARLSGVRTNRVRMGAYALNGLCVGIAAILFTARTNTGQPSSAIGYELDAIAAVVVGGGSLVGGIGNILGTFVGALFMGCVNTLLQLEGVDPYVGMGWKGLIILLAVYLQNLGRAQS